MERISEKIINLSQDSYKKFAKEFINEYTKDAFGSMSSKEIQILVFKLLRDIDIISENDSHYTISRLLKIPQTRVKSLVLQNQLRDPTIDEKYILHQLASVLDRSEFIRDNTYISIGIENPLVRAELEARLKNLGNTPDYSFNSEILKISLDKFALFLEDILGDDQKTNFLEKIKKEENFKAFVGDTVKQTLSNILSSLTINALSYLSKTLLSL